MITVDRMAIVIAGVDSVSLCEVVNDVRKDFFKMIFILKVSTTTFWGHSILAPIPFVDTSLNNRAPNRE